MKWRDDAQKKNCEATLENLRAAFLRARYYSIQGDSCACAENAALFLSIYEKAKPSCPENFLINEGYNDRITRNMGWLQVLGEKRCLGPGTAPDANAESKAAQNPETPHASTPQRTAADADTPLGKPTAAPQ
ncbi:hypothetical protein [Desulfosarcina sp.]|uniref:hypothetical protein n=1 Tax=Desulfosarcina sp. TaxID=2027861 RepID=UPI0039709F43